MVLQTGEFLPLPSYDDIFAYARVIRNGHDVFGQEAKNDAYLVAFNRSRYESKWVSFDVSDFANGVFVDAFDETRKFPVTRKRVNFELKPLVYHNSNITTDAREFYFTPRACLQHTALAI